MGTRSLNKGRITHRRRKQSYFTLSEARDVLSDLGIVIRKQDGEYRVNYRGGYEATAGYTNDLDEAVQTGRYLAKHKAEWKCSCGATEQVEGPDGWSACAGCGRV